MKPALSDHIRAREPSEIRKAQILFHERADRDDVEVINLAIGNVARPTHPALFARMKTLTSEGPFAGGVVKYTASEGLHETQQAILHIIGLDGADSKNLSCIITDGGSMAMELLVLATSGPAGTRPLALIEPAYTNYRAMAARNAVRTVSLARHMDDDGAFTPPDLNELEALFRRENPGALVVIPADNPTGQYLEQDVLIGIAKLCVAHGVWLVSDEAYRQLHYRPGVASSVWRITEAEVPGITGTRIGIESASKVWNACGLRVGALVTDNDELQKRIVAEYTANLCANAIGQWVFGALLHQSKDELRAWCETQRGYYAALMQRVSQGLREQVPGLIVSKPDAALYSVLDVRHVANADFDASAFVKLCATEGKERIAGKAHTLLVSPMAGFYSGAAKAAARTQMRLAYVEPEDKMAKVPALFGKLFARFANP